MIDYQTFRLMHLHDEARIPMTERPHPDAAASDPERGWGSGARIFQCTRCDEQVVVMPQRAEAEGEAA